jgi:hypothetical protein
MAVLVDQLPKTQMGWKPRPPERRRAPSPEHLLCILHSRNDDMLVVPTPSPNATLGTRPAGFGERVRGNQPSGDEPVSANDDGWPNLNRFGKRLVLANTEKTISQPLGTRYPCGRDRTNNNDRPRQHVVVVVVVVVDDDDLPSAHSDFALDDHIQ